MRRVGAAATRSDHLYLRLWSRCLVAAGFRDCRVSLYADYGRDFGDFASECSFYSHSQRHFTGGAVDAGPEKSDRDGAVVVYVDQFDVAAVALHGRTQCFQDRLHAVAQSVLQRSRFRFTGHQVIR